MNPKVTCSSIFLVFYYKDFPINKQTNLFVWFPRFFFSIIFPPKKTLKFFLLIWIEKTFFVFCFFNVVFKFFFPGK